MIKPDIRQLVIALFLLILSGWLLFGIEPVSGSARSMQKFWDMGHLLLFFVFVAYLYRFTRLRTLKVSYQFMLVCLVGLVIGGGVELIQRDLQRQADLHDLYLDLMGGLLAFIVFADLWQARPRWKVAVASGLLCVASWPVLSTLLDEYQARNDFPLLSDLERPFELSRWTSQHSISISHRIKHSGCCSLKMHLHQAEYGSAKLQYIEHDWQDYKQLMVDVYNPVSQMIEMWISVDDDFHGADRYVWPGLFIQRYQLSPGWNQLALKYADQLEQIKRQQPRRGNIQGVIFYIEQPHDGLTLYFDNVRLSR